MTKSGPGFASRLRAHFAQRLRTHGQAGSAAIEFSFIAPIFFLLVFAIIETGILYFAQATLQFATQESARLVKTGQVQGAAMSQTAFRQKICDIITPILACDGNLVIDMRAYTNFSGTSFNSPLDANGNMKSGQNNFQPGTAGQVVLVRVMYTWKVLTPVLTPFLINMSGDNHLLTGTAAFRNEPF